MDSSMSSPRAFLDELLSSLSTGRQKLSFVLSTLLQLLLLVTVFIIMSTVLIIEFGLSSLSTGLQKLSSALSTLLQLLLLVTVFIVVSTILIVELGLQGLRPKERLVSLARFLNSNLEVLEDKAFEALKGVFLLVLRDIPRVGFYIAALSVSVLVFHSFDLFLLIFFVKCCFARIPEAALADGGGDEGEGEANGEERSTPDEDVNSVATEEDGWVAVENLS